MRWFTTQYPADSLKGKKKIIIFCHMNYSAVVDAHSKHRKSFWVMSVCTCNPNALASVCSKHSVSDSFFFYTLGFDDVNKSRSPYYGHVMLTALAVSSGALPTCCSHLLFVRGSQSEKCGLRGRRKKLILDGGWTEQLHWGPGLFSSVNHAKLL